MKEVNNDDTAAVRPWVTMPEVFATPFSTPTASIDASLTRLMFSETERADILAAHQPRGSSDDLSAITDFAAALCGTPIALVTLIDRDIQLFAGRTGFAVSEAPRGGSLCLHTMLGNGLTIIPDTLADPRFRDAPSVVGEPHIRFYAGMPLISEEGAPLGALCVVDQLPRTSLSALQLQGLAVLRSAALEILRRRRSQRDGTVARAKAQAQHDEQEARFEVLADAMPHMVWSTLPDGYHDYFNSRWYEFTGVPTGSTDGARWKEMFHPDDQDKAWNVWRQSLATGEPYEIEYRLRNAAGVFRWVFGRALPMRNVNGEIVRWFGTCTDIHDQKLVLEQREIISNELSHRIKNIFAVVTGLISLTTREHPSFKPVADDLRGRVTALGRAHDYVRLHSPGSRTIDQRSTLHGILEDLLAPYRANVVDRFLIEGNDLVIDDRVATPMALAFHELATNASKYGALSTPEGRLRIAVVSAAGMVEIEWREADGPVVRTPHHSGFGTRLLELSVERQLGGTVERIWNKDGLVVKLTVPVAAMGYAQTA